MMNNLLRGIYLPFNSFREFVPQFESRDSRSMHPETKTWNLEL